VFVIAWAPSEDRSLPDFDYEEGGGTGDVSGGVEDVDGEERDRVERPLHPAAGGTGSIGRRRLSSVGSPAGIPIPRHKPSLIGISSAQVGFSLV
jgi:hypothetical protein